jgi:hypothetical protein
MSTPYEYITATGVVVADTSDIQTQVQNEWRTAFGQDLSVDDSTPQGVMINAETTTRRAVALANAKLANQINPNNAGGVFLDALCALMGLTRAKATATVVQNVTLTGVLNTPIQAGTRASIGPGGTVFALQTSVVLANDGSGGGIALATFVCQTLGPVACGDGALNTPVDVVLGWETITNNQEGTPPSVTVLGTNQQSDSSLRALRNNTLALQGISTPTAQVSGLYALPGVTSVAYLENVDSTTEVINGITLKPHSVWACVDGGLQLDIATSLLENKTDGAGWNGAVMQPVVEPASGQTYQVQFDRPQYVFIFGAMTIQQGTFVGNLQQAAAQAVFDYFIGEIDGFEAVGIAADVSPFEISAAVVAACPGCKVRQCLIGTSAGSLSPNDIVMTQIQRGITSNTAFTITVQ